VLKTGMEKGAGISYDRLEDLVRELQSSVSDKSLARGRWEGMNQPLQMIR
jgi:hypothetical protein